MGCSQSTANPSDDPPKLSRNPSLLTQSPRSKLQEEILRELQEMEQGVIEPKGPHTHTVIMLHGLGNKGMDFVSSRGSKGLPATILDLQVTGTDGIKYIFPTAPSRLMYWEGKDWAPSEHPASAWYTYYSDYSGTDQADNDIINREEYDASVKEVVDLVKSEAKLLGDTKRIIIGGYAQGGTVAIGAAMALRTDPPAAIVGINTLPMSFTQLDLETLAMPVYSFVGGDDKVYPPSLQKERWARLSGSRLTQHAMRGVPHGPYAQIMNEIAAKWMMQAFYEAANAGHRPVIDASSTRKIPEPPVLIEDDFRTPAAWWMCSTPMCNRCY